MSTTESGRRGRRGLLMLAAVVLVAAAAVVVILVASGGDDDAGGDQAAQPAATTPPGPQRFESRPDLHPPVVTVDKGPARSGRQLILVSPRMEEPKRDAATHQQGALAVDGQGRTVWFRPAPKGEPMTDVRVQEYEGEPVMTWWQGAASKIGIGRGEGVIVDQSYETVATVQAGNGLSLDLHELRLTPRGTALLTIYNRDRADLTSMGGKRDALVTEGVVQEVDVESGDVLFEWHSLEEVEPSESVRPLPKGPEDSFDYFHINSVAEDTDGNLLVSARNTSAVYKIDRDTGKLMWRLGGKKSDFEMGPGTEFGLQHDAQRVDGGGLRIFDNGAAPEEGQPPQPSSVKTLRLDMDRMRATLDTRLEHPDAMYAESQGNADDAAAGGTVVGWGSTGSFSWFGPDDRLRFDAHLPAYYDSYRAYGVRWVGRPKVAPAIRARRAGAQVTVWASWNGSTEVRSWQILAGESREELTPVGPPAPWDGLETTIIRQVAAPVVAVAALDEDGEQLRRSAAVRVGPVPPPPAP